MRSLHTGLSHELAPGELLTHEGRHYELREIDAAQLVLRLSPDVARTALARAPEERTPEALTQLLEACGLSNEEAGEVCGVRRQTISEWRNGHRAIPKSAFDSLTLHLVRRDLALAQKAGLK